MAREISTTKVWTCIRLVTRRRCWRCDLNDAPLDPDHGAPVRLRIPTQLGYKSAKWIARIELVGRSRRFIAGRGGYWEDQGYEWYAGI